MADLSLYYVFGVILYMNRILNILYTWISDVKAFKHMLGFWLNIPQNKENTLNIYIGTGRDIFLAFLGPSR
jgi:hypothetical protein